MKNKDFREFILSLIELRIATYISHEDEKEFYNEIFEALWGEAIEIEARYYK